jgi:L-asparaginase/Glu-tRNA(Gln) amidotransferase subunit D
MKTHGKTLHWLPVALGIGLPLACAAADLPLIKIIATGGTIATVYDAQKKAGVVMGDDLGPWKSRILLMLAMTKTRDPAELQKYFDR